MARIGSPPQLHHEWSKRLPSPAGRLWLPPHWAPALTLAHLTVHPPQGARGILSNIELNSIKFSGQAQITSHLSQNVTQVSLPWPRRPYIITLATLPLAPSTLTFLKHAGHAPTTGPLRMLFPLSETFFLQICTCKTPLMPSGLGPPQKEDFQAPQTKVPAPQKSLFQYFA